MLLDNKVWQTPHIATARLYGPGRIVDPIRPYLKSTLYDPIVNVTGAKMAATRKLVYAFKICIFQSLSNLI